MLLIVFVIARPLPHVPGIFRCSRDPAQLRSPEAVRVGAILWAAASESSIIGCDDEIERKGRKEEARASDGSRTTSSHLFSAAGQHTCALYITWAGVISVQSCTY